MPAGVTKLIKLSRQCRPTSGFRAQFGVSNDTGWLKAGGGGCSVKRLKWNHMADNASMNYKKNNYRTTYQAQMSRLDAVYKFK